MAKIFISYSSRDAEIADQVYTALTASGHQVWMDREALKGGQDWMQAIQDNLLWADTLVVLWSANALNSEWVQDEIAFARSNHKQIIPLRLDNTDPSTHIIINSLQLIDLRDGNVERAVERLNAALSYDWPIRYRSELTSRPKRWPIFLAVALLAVALLMAPSVIRSISQRIVPTPTAPATHTSPPIDIDPTATITMQAQPQAASIDTLNAWRQVNGYAPLVVNQILQDVAEVHLLYLRSLSLTELEQTNRYRDADGHDAQWMVNNAGYTGQVQMFVEVTEADRVPLDDLLFGLETQSSLPDLHTHYREIGLVAEEALNTGLYYFVLILGTG